MYEIKDQRGNVLASCGTFVAAEQRLDEICRQTAEHAADNDDWTPFSWTIVDTDTGELVATMTMVPDGTGHYQSIIAPEDNS